MNSLAVLRAIACREGGPTITPHPYAGASLVTGFRPTIGVGAFVLFIVPVTLIMHNFWAQIGLAQIAELRACMGNVGLLGSALMFLAIPQPWGMSLAGLAGALRAMTRKGRPARAA